jgi:AAA15 family ATPase/GTPase
MSNDISRSNKYKEIKNKIKEECSKLTYPNTNFDCEAIFIEDIDYYFKRDLDYYTMKIFPKILKRIKMPNYKIPTETNKNKNKKNDEDFIKEFAENNDMTIKEAVGQLKTVFL